MVRYTHMVDNRLSKFHLLMCSKCESVSRRFQQGAEVPSSKGNLCKGSYPALQLPLFQECRCRRRLSSGVPRSSATTRTPPTAASTTCACSGARCWSPAPGASYTARTSRPATGPGDHTALCKGGNKISEKGASISFVKSLLLAIPY